MKAIIIDDEPQARKLLKNLLKEFLPEVDLIADCEDLPNGVKAIRKLKPDLVLLDIEMPGHSGLELLEFFNEDEIDFGIIFTTAYNQYAVKAFKLNAIDYLLKPIDADELVQAINRFEKNRPKKEQVMMLKESLQGQSPSRIAVPVGQSISFLELSTILYLKAENTYTEIHFQNKTKLLVSRTLKNFEDTLLDFPNFFRCHKSYMINKEFIDHYVKSDGGYLKLKNGEDIPINAESVDILMGETVIVKR